MKDGGRKSFNLPESRVHYPPPREIHVRHVKIELEVDFEKKRVEGACTLRIEPISEGLRRVLLDAHGMEIGPVAVDGAVCETVYDGEKLSVRTPPLGAGTHDLRVEYSTAPRDGIYFIGPDEMYPNKPLQAWTHSEAQFARYWFPCFDYPSEKFTSETVITVPRGFRVISNGDLVSNSSAGDKVTFHWKEKEPHPSYLTSFVAGKFGEVKEESEGVPLYYYFPEERREDVGRYFGETPDMIRVFNQVTGVRYPFTKYAQTTVEDFIFGGMEHVDATTLATTRFHDESSHEDFQTSYGTPNRGAVSLVAHELAHQWFGDLVTCADWAHAWLNEGFADYMQLLYTERTRGRDEMRWDMALTAEDVISEDLESYRRPIVERNFVFADDLFDDTLYKKGAWMIHELRFLVGDAAFFRGIRTYLERFAHGNADTHDFRKVMEEVSGLSLEQFFDQSFHKGGYPELEVEYSWSDTERTAMVRIRQVQTLDDLTPLFQIPCDLVFYTARGRQKKKVWIRGADQSFSFELDSEPTIVEVDPEQWLLKKTSFRKGTALLTRQLEGSEDASSRAAAAKELGDSKASQAVEALDRAASKEQFWFVNACALNALGDIGTPEALDCLLRMGRPANRRVRRALANALGKFKDKRARKVIEELLRSDQSPYVRCEAAFALAKSAGAEALPLLKETMRDPSPNDTLAEACLDAMGDVGGTEVDVALAAALPYGNPTRVRLGAMKGMKRRGYIREQEVPALKAILLEDKEFAVRDYLVEKLIPDAGDERFLDSLRTAASTDRDNRVRRGALEAIHLISKGAGVARTIAKLKEEVEVLKAQGRSPPAGSG